MNKKTKPSRAGLIQFDPIQLGNYERTFNGIKYESSSSYQSKSKAKLQADYLKKYQVKARVVKYKKGYVVFSNSDKTKGKLVPRTNKRKNKKK